MPVRWPQPVRPLGHKQPKIKQVVAVLDIGLSNMTLVFKMLIIWLPMINRYLFSRCQSSQLATLTLQDSAQISKLLRPHETDKDTTPKRTQQISRLHCISALDSRLLYTDSDTVVLNLRHSCKIESSEDEENMWLWFNWFRKSFIYQLGFFFTCK